MNSFITPKEFAAYFQIHVMSVYRLIKQGKIKVARLSRIGKILIPDTEIRRIERSGWLGEEKVSG